jgi:hypothetical protein
MKIFLLDPISGIFQTFQDHNQIYSFAGRSTRNFRGKILIVRNGTKVKIHDFNDETPTEIYNLVLKLQHEIK